MFAFNILRDDKIDGGLSFTALKDDQRRCVGKKQKMNKATAKSLKGKKGKKVTIPEEAHAETEAGHVDSLQGTSLWP